MLISVFVLVVQIFAVHGNVDCSIGDSSCRSCLQTSPDCYWCESETGIRCKQYINIELAQLFCPSRWTHKLCSATSVEDVKPNKLNKMLELLHGIRSYSPEKESHQNDALSNLIDSKNDVSLNAHNVDSTSNSDLKDLLHKLILLKLLRKVKNEGISTLSKEDRILLEQLSLKTTTTTKAPVTEANVNNEISELLQLLNKEPSSKDEKSTTTGWDNKSLNTTTIPVEVTTTMKMNLQSLNNHVESVSVDYNENEEDDLNHLGQSRNTITNKSQTEVHKSYCKVYEGPVMCNKDNNCTWCNTVNTCIQRNDQSYDACVHSKIKDYDVDPCFSSKHCKQCVADDKCYWCDVSKSCHTYPFFGYVPQSCGGDWFVKQCDVQLAVIIIVLPLIMILLALVTFYFCLKYCYYRRKVLRVPLFERPGVFDYRKDKKVYFVHPDDESSENELEAEKFRKKYRLPVEKEPLIDPNS